MRACCSGGPRGAERDAAAVTELDDAFSALAAAAQEIQHALEVSEEDAWQSAAARDAQMLHNDLMFAAAHAEMAEPRATIEGVMHAKLLHTPSYHRVVCQA